MTTGNTLFPLLRDSLFSRIVASILIIALILLVTKPLAAALNEPPEPTEDQVGTARSAGELLSGSLREARELLGAADARLRRGESIAEERMELAALRKHAAQLNTHVLADFAAIGDILGERGVPARILDRHRETVSLYQQEIQAVLEDLAIIEAAGDDVPIALPIERVHQRLSERRLQASQQPFDPTELPHQAQQPRQDNLPRIDKGGFIGAGLFDTPLMHLAALDGYLLDGLPGAEDPDYLADTDEIRLSAEIRAKAAELNHDPVAIYHWVRNHIEWVPSWGAVQNADLTVSARRGNAMDVASLLLSLLRASGVPARYVHGTIEVPAEAFRNWAGGFERIEEAMSYAASGGIPVTGLIQGGRITHVRMEHVWVEAAIDFLPSRGAVMRDADTWLALDASYKQYVFVPGLDVSLITGLDGDGLLLDLLATGTVNEAEGWIQGLDAAGVLAAQREAEERLTAHVEQLEAPTAADVIGGGKVVLREAQVLPSGLPYQRAIEGARYAALPASLQPRLTLGLGADVLGQFLHEATFPWASLNNRKLTLSFRPATEDDQVALEALLPDGEIDDPSQLPSSIPAYLIDVVPEVKIDGETALIGSPMPLGDELAFSYSVTDPVHGTRHYPNKVVAGSYLALGVIGGGVAAVGIDAAAQQLRETARILNTGDQALLGSLTREDLLGDLFHAGLLSYFGQYQTLGTLKARTQSSHFQLTTSAGSFGYVPTVTYLFGIPRSIMAGGVVMDLDRVAHVSSTDGQGQEVNAALNFQLGALASGLEHAVPEQMFVPEGSTGEGVSAVRALQKAIAMGQRVYHITPANQADALPHIRQNALTMNEIRSSLAVGREVIVHTDPISVPGWQGAGYIVFDPKTGAGAWKIAGGANGGFLAASDLASTIGSVTLLTLATGPVGGFLAGAVFSVTLGYMRNTLTEGAFCR
ncbi:MAG: transglutaminase-like domain-containing protein [Thioalkalivibrio sp.]|nr:transglutaminase-like domain-containing protein [Thioalkalivibrio sp.]